MLWIRITDNSQVIVIHHSIAINVLEFDISRLNFLTCISIIGNTVFQYIRFPYLIEICVLINSIKNMSVEHSNRMSRNGNIRISIVEITPVHTACQTRFIIVQ